MQTTENEEKQLPADPQSQPLNPVSPAQEEDEDDPEQIFIRAVAEIDTQPLVRKKRNYSFRHFVEDVFCLSMIFMGVAGIIWQCITYPHMLIILYEKAMPAQVTTTLDLPIRNLAPVTLTRYATIATTGQGHQTATTATGQVTFYNGLSIEQIVPAGTKLTGSDGEQII